MTFRENLASKVLNRHNFLVPCLRPPRPLLLLVVLLALPHHEDGPVLPVLLQGG